MTDIKGTHQQLVIKNHIEIEINCSWLKNRKSNIFVSYNKIYLAISIKNIEILNLENSTIEQLISVFTLFFSLMNRVKPQK